ncbi:hypothetical protein MES5069_220168 [Mesorhizobium escarrei]|uniref:Uncharacterized protein n=1 Tax=Mesorhizobium escarrei TaxID=666018 RepID=A0ABM9DTE7_9HYPH|nr:hypothetical protein MES5069_220168 [Mesorhizobium escarrei]
MPGPPDKSDELSKAFARIADLERLVGQKTADLVFFASLGGRTFSRNTAAVEKNRAVGHLPCEYQSSIAA